MAGNHHRGTRQDDQRGIPAADGRTVGIAVPVTFSSIHRSATRPPSITVTTTARQGGWAHRPDRGAGAAHWRPRVLPGGYHRRRRRQVVWAAVRRRRVRRAGMSLHLQIVVSGQGRSPSHRIRRHRCRVIMDFAATARPTWRNVTRNGIHHREILGLTCPTRPVTVWLSTNVTADFQQRRVHPCQPYERRQPRATAMSPIYAPTCRRRTPNSTTGQRGLQTWLR